MVDDNKKTALITGGSSGIGLELAKIHARGGGDLILVARRGDRLEKLKDELIKENPNLTVTLILQDLSEHGAAEKVYMAVKEYGLEVDYLINNAGYGGHDFFHERSWERHEAMIQVNTVALTGLTKLFLEDMILRRSGKILNVASTAGFAPGPLQAVYYASKSYVISFSEAISNELKEYNISVTVLCPGATNTEFFVVADTAETRAFKRPIASVVDVAESGYSGMLKGKTVVVPGIANKFLVFITRFTPRSLLLKTSRYLMEKT
ncbi:MAG: SDR family oxidoreductase [Chlamydiota bacterium]